MTQKNEHKNNDGKMNQGLKMAVGLIVFSVLITFIYIGSFGFLLFTLTKKNYMLAKLSLLINKKNLYKTEDYYGFTPLHLVVSNGDLKATKVLLSSGVNVDVRSKKQIMKCVTYCTPLDIAVGNGDIEIAQYLISKGADVNVKDGNGFSPIHSAVQNPENREILLLLIEHKADVNIRNIYNITPLHMASRSRRHYNTTPVINILLANGADCNANDNGGNKALVNPGKSGEFIEHLKKLGIDVYKNSKNTVPPLHRASKAGNLEAVKFLIQNHAYINKKDLSGHTPLHYAKLSGNKELIRFLEEKGGKEQ